jgi:PKD repeat protein
MKKYHLVLFTFLAFTALLSCTKDYPDPIADFSFTGDGNPAPCVVLFENKSLEATTYYWDFGDETYSYEINPVKTFESGGTFTVTLTAEGKGGTASISKEVVIGNPKPVVEISTAFIQLSLPNNCPTSFQISNIGPFGSILDYVVADDGVLGGFLSIENATGSVASGSSATITVTVKPEFVQEPGGAGGSTFVLSIYTPEASNEIKNPVSVVVTNFLGLWGGTWSGRSYSNGLPWDPVFSPVSGSWVLYLQSVNMADNTASGQLSWYGTDKYWVFTYDTIGNIISSTPMPYIADCIIQFNSENTTLLASETSCDIIHLTIVGAPPNQNIFYGPWFNVFLDTKSNTTILSGEYDGFATHPADPNSNWVGLSQGSVTGSKQ